MKHIILIFCLGFILNSCKKESACLSNVDSDVVVELKFSSSNSSSSRSIGDVESNTKIDEITVLIFEEGGSNKYLYRRSGIVPLDNKFTAILIQTDDPISIHVFANPNSSINSTVYNGQTETQVINSLVTNLDLNAASTDALPMHGSLNLLNLTGDIDINAVIYLLRGVIRVDMNANAVPENIFTLGGISVHHTPNSGRWVSNYRIDKNGNPATPIVTAPTMPPSPITTITATHSAPAVVIDNKIVNQLFIYENTATTPPNGSRIVVAGSYNGGATTYYPIDFTSSEEAPINILRNHHYTINITAITGSGYNNEEDAANGASIDIAADIIAWNAFQIDGTIDPELETILSAPSVVLLNAASNDNSFTRTISYSSNEEVKLFLGGVEVPFPGNSTPVDLEISPWQQMWLTTATWTPTNNLEGKFEFTHQVLISGTAENYFVTLKSGNITRNMEVVYGE